MTMKMSNLPKDLVEEILSRVPMKSLGAVRLTCKNWNALFKTQSFTKMRIDKEEAAAKQLEETRVIVIMDYNVYLMGVVINKNPSIESLDKLTFLDGSEQVEISQVFHCEGLLLCILKDDDTKIVVWNPYLGQTRWIQTRKYYRRAGWKGQDMYNYALGYVNNSESSCCRSPKILRFIDDFRFYPITPALRYEIYDFDSDLWTTLDVIPHWHIISDYGISLKGNTYWGAVEWNSYAPIKHIICFDYTRQIFGPLLPLPFSVWGGQFASLSSVREEKIVALFQLDETSNVAIWITTKIEANNVSWSNFFTMSTSISWLFNIYPKISKNFFIDEERKVAAVFCKNVGKNCNYINIIEKAGSLRKLQFGESAKTPLVCSYVPSIVQIKQHQGARYQKEKKTNLLRKVSIRSKHVEMLAF